MVSNNFSGSPVITKKEENINTVSVYSSSPLLARR